jgi:hypothetical protein
MGSRKIAKWKFTTQIAEYETTKALIESVSSFSDCVRYVWESKWREGRDTLQRKYPEYIEEEFPWFRGVRSIEYDLIPGLYWLFKPKKRKQVINVAEDIREEFRRRGEYLLSGSHQELEDGELYMLMQHYAVPTRLLDWTEGALIALYFAIRESAFVNDKNSKPLSPCVWILNPSWLNDRSIRSPLPVYLTESAMGKYPKTDRKARKYLCEKRLPSLPVAVYPQHLDPKVRTQRSVFTLHGKVKNAFKELCRSDPAAQVCRLRIRPEAIADIAKELRLMGITESTIFPDLKGLANEIRNEKGVHFSFDR